MKKARIKSEIALRIEERLKALKLSASAASTKAGLSRYAISNIQKNPESVPRGQTLIQLAQVLETTPEFLLTGEGGGGDDLGHRRVPIVSWVSAGKMTRDDGQQDVIGHVPGFNLDRRGKWIALRVEGDSMDRISPPESLIIVDLADRKLVPNACYIISNGDDEVTYKRYRSNPARFEPVSTNPAHESIFPEGEPAVVGRVRKTILDM